MSTVTENSNSKALVDSNQLSRPKGVVLISLILVLWVILDLLRANGTTNMLLWSLVIFRIMVILGLMSMARWGYWMTVIYLLVEAFLSAPNLSTINEIASSQGLDGNLLSVRFLILVDLFWAYIVVLLLVFLIFFYVTVRKEEFKY